VRAELDGERLSTDEIAAFVRMLFPAGFETTMKGLSNALVGLLTSGQWALVREDRSLVTRAIEEGLRWQTSVLGMPRVATSDVEVAGMPVPAGDVVLCFAASANRDETRWPDADRYDLTRAPQPHVAFGVGPHVCLGMQLARAEGATALHALLGAVPELELVPGCDDDVRPSGLAFRGPRAIPIRLGARSGSLTGR
jgi:cytochrome P450